jgi:6-phospho-beta-glucosidase
VTVDGVDRLPELLDVHGEFLAAHLGAPVGWMRRMGVIPSYYLKYFYAHDKVVEQRRTERPRADVVSDVEEELLKVYADPPGRDQAGGTREAGRCLLLRSSLATRARADQRWSGRGARGQHNGTMPFLPDDAVIEVPSLVDASGATPLPVRLVEPLYAGLNAAVTAYENLALVAAVRGGRDRVADALLAHPLVGQYAQADQLADTLVQVNHQFLPWAHA